MKKDGWSRLSTINNKNNCISDLVDWHAKNNQLEHLFFVLSKFSDSVFQVSIVFTTSFISVSLSQSKKKIDHLIDIMQRLVFSVCTL